MLLELPQETVQLITQTAEQQGVSVAELLNSTFHSEPDLFLDSELNAIELESKQFDKAMALLDEPPKHNPKLQALLELTKNM